MKYVSVSLQKDPHECFLANAKPFSRITLLFLLKRITLCSKYVRGVCKGLALNKRHSLSEFGTKCSNHFTVLSQDMFWILRKPRENMSNPRSAEAVNYRVMYHGPVINGAFLVLGSTHGLKHITINLFLESVKIFVRTYYY